MDTTTDLKQKKVEKAFYLSSDYKGPVRPVNLDKTSRSVKLHVKKIIEANPESVLDLGCGAGGILLALQNAGIEEIHGIDASPEAIKMVQKRFEKFGTLEKTSFIAGDIIHFDPPVVDVVSSHSVLCCHPNAIGIVNKATQRKPKMIIITFPKDNFSMKLFTFFANIFFWVIGRFNKSIRGQKIYAHSTEMVNTAFKENGYKLIFNDETFINQTLIYEYMI